MHSSKIAVLLWLYHVDQWEEFISLLYPIKNNIQLYIGLYNNQSLNIIKDYRLKEISYSIEYFDNCGADILPFLRQINGIQEDYFIKLHSKKSNIGFNNQINWKTLLIHDLIGTKELFFQNYNKIQEKSIGMISNRQCLFKNMEFTNTKHIIYLCELLDIDYEKLKEKKFVGGNMFFSKTRIFKKYFQNRNDIYNLLKLEQGKISDYRSGRFCHALERIFGYIIEYENLNFYYPEHNNIKIYNQENNKFFNMIVTYNNECYIDEDPNIYGKIIEVNSNYYKINWLHKNTDQIYTYKINNNIPILYRI